jgi:serine/threonine-protein kinase
VRLGAYVLQRELGRGAMGRVCLAVHESLGVARAVKLLDVDADPQAVERFRRETESLARAGGEGVVPIHESGVEGRTLWFAMDLMPGGSLRDRLSQRGPFAWRDAVELVRRLAQALGRCHAAGLVHRDVKLENVLFDEQDEPRLADFGLVRDLSASRLTQTGALVGTPAYMAPELFAGQPAGAAADVFSLGAVLYELVTAERPHQGKNVQEIFRAARARKRKSASAACGAPEALDRVIDRALDPDPARRTPDGAALARELAGLLAGEKDAGKAPRFRNRSVLVPVACAAVVLVASALVLGRRGEEAASPGAPPLAASDPARPARVVATPSVASVASARLRADAARAVALARSHVPDDFLMRPRGDQMRIALESVAALRAAKVAGVDLAPETRAPLVETIHVVAVMSPVDESVPFWRQLLELEPDNAAIRGDAIQSLGPHLWTPDARTLYITLVTERARDSAVAREERAHCYAEAVRTLGSVAIRRYDEANALLDEARKLSGDDPDLTLASAETLSSQGRHAEAYERTQGLAERCEGSLGRRILFFRAAELLANGGADRCLEALESVPWRDEVDALLLRTRAYKALGKLDEARATLATAGRIAADHDSEDERIDCRRTAHDLEIEGVLKY